MRFDSDDEFNSIEQEAATSLSSLKNSIVTLTSQPAPSIDSQKSLDSKKGKAQKLVDISQKTSAFTSSPIPGTDIQEFAQQSTPDKSFSHYSRKTRRHVQFTPEHTYIKSVL